MGKAELAAKRAIRRMPQVGESHSDKELCRGEPLNGVQEVGGSNPLAPIVFRNEPFGENVEGLSHCGDTRYSSMNVFN
jgi:hypothetical protein